MPFRLPASSAIVLCIVFLGCGQSAHDQGLVRVRPAGNSVAGDARPATMPAQPRAADIGVSIRESVATAEGDTSGEDTANASVSRADQFLAADDVFALVVHPHQLSDSSALAPVLEHFSVASQITANSTAMQWVCISGTVDAFDTGHEMENMTITARTLTSIDPTVLLESRFPNANSEPAELDGLEYLRLSGMTNQSLEMVTDTEGRTSAVKRVQSVPPMAFYQSDAHTFVLCAESRLQDALNPDSGRALRERLNMGLHGAPVVLAAVNLSEDIVVPKSVNLFVPHFEDVVHHADAFVISIRPDHMQPLSAQVFVAEGHGRNALSSALRRCHRETSDRMAGFGALASAEVKPVLGALHDLFAAAEVVLHDDSVELTLSRDGGLREFCQSLLNLLQPTVAAR